MKKILAKLGLMGIEVCEKNSFSACSMDESRYIIYRKSTNGDLDRQLASKRYDEVELRKYFILAMDMSNGCRVDVWCSYKDECLTDKYNAKSKVSIEFDANKTHPIIAFFGNNEANKQVLVVVNKYGEEFEVSIPVILDATSFSHCGVSKYRPIHIYRICTETEIDYIVAMDLVIKSNTGGKDIYEVYLAKVDVEGRNLVDIVAEIGLAKATRHKVAGDDKYYKQNKEFIYNIKEEYKLGFKDVINNITDDFKLDTRKINEEIEKPILEKPIPSRPDIGLPIMDIQPDFI